MTVKILLVFVAAIKVFWMNVLIRKALERKVLKVVLNLELF